MIALTVLFPIVSVLSYGIFEREDIRRHERRITKMEAQAFTRVLGNVRNEKNTDRDVERENRKKLLRKQIITVTGSSGSGVSSTVREVANRLRYRSFSSGDFFRKIANEHGISVEELNALAETYSSIDQEVDELVREFGEIDSKLVIDSRLGYHWIHDSFKVYLAIDQRVAAERAFAHAKEGGRLGEKAESVEAIQEAMENRASSQRKRYQSSYGLDIMNTKPFDLVIDTGENDLETTVKTIIEKYRAWYGRDL
jgi:predicted cytidylate kinase